MSKFNIILIFVFLLFNALFAQEKGKINGFVVDDDTGEPIPGVNVLVKGTYLGASTDLDGFFQIQEVAPGEYELEVSFIGYKIIRQTGIKVEAGKTTNLEFDMQPSVLALGQEIEVIGERPLMDIEQTGTSRTLNADDIEQSIVENALDLVSQQVGIVKQDNQIHIRGGRAYEAQYLLDGLSIQDPLSGTGFGLNISANSIEEVEVLTGGFKAEYGQATSGVVVVKTKSGGDKYSGFFSYKMDNPGFFKDQDFSFNTDNIEFNLGGPEPVSSQLLPSFGLDIPGNIYFFTNFYALVADDYTGATANQLYSSITPTGNIFGQDLFNNETFAPRQNNSWSGLFKLDWKITPVQQLTFAYNRSLAVNQNTTSLQTNLEYVEPSPGFPYDFSKNLDNFNTYTHDNEHVSLTWKHTLNKTTFYELRLSQYFAHLRSDWQGNSWRDYIRNVDVPRLPVEYFIPFNDSTKIRVIPGDGFYDYGNKAQWHDHYVEWYTFKGDLTSRIGDIHTLKSGFEFSVKEMQLVDIIDPWIGQYGSSQDIYKVYPADGAIYVQDDIRFEGFILNAGLRLDYWFPGKFADDAVEDTTTILSQGVRDKYLDETYQLFDSRFKLRLMPRIGVSHPISNNLMLFFNYGHFSKQPKPQYLYAKLGPVSAKSAYQKYGNPALNPMTSVKYELGLRVKFTENDVLSVNAYYTDIFDYIQTVSFTSFQRGVSGITYTNLDYARSRGIELEYKTRIGKYFFANANGSYSITTTKSSTADVGYLIAKQTLDEPPIKETFARWDRPWQISVNSSIRIPRDNYPDLFGIKLFDNWDLNMRLFTQAGKRYTPVELSYIRDQDGRPMYEYVEDQTRDYEKIAKHWMWVDLNFTKYFNLWDIEYAFMVEIKNLFNQKNPQIINPVTGDAYEYGDPVLSSWNDPLYPDRFPDISPYPLNPARYRAPRHILFGMSVNF